MSEQQDVEINRSLLAYLSAAMFFLAGMIELLTGLFSRGRPHGPHSPMVFMGILFLSCSLLWIAAGLKWKKERLQRDVAERK